WPGVAGAMIGSRVNPAGQSETGTSRIAASIVHDVSSAKTALVGIGCVPLGVSGIDAPTPALVTTWRHVRIPYCQNGGFRVFLSTQHAPEPPAGCGGHPCGRNFPRFTATGITCSPTRSTASVCGPSSSISTDPPNTNPPSNVDTFGSSRRNSSRTQTNPAEKWVNFEGSTT